MCATTQVRQIIKEGQDVSVVRTLGGNAPGEMMHSLAGQRIWLLLHLVHLKNDPFESAKGNVSRNE